MSEWWTYSLSDFLLFSPRIYRRLFELFNADTWPLHLPALLAGAVVAWAMRRGGIARWRLAAALMAIAWAWVAYAFFVRHYASIHWAAPAFAAAFAVEAVLLAIAAATVPRTMPGPPRAGRAGVALLALGLLLQPLIGPLLGRPWRQLEVFGMAPDPTTTVTLGLLLLWPSVRWQALLWVVPLAWCAVGAATLWTMQDADAVVMPAVAAVAVATALLTRRSVN